LPITEVYWSFSSFAALSVTVNVPTTAFASAGVPPVALVEPPFEPGDPPVPEPPVPEPPVGGVDGPPPVAGAGSFESDEHPKAAAAALKMRETLTTEKISLRKWLITGSRCPARRDKN
jgi:hypothetical protein